MIALQPDQYRLISPLFAEIEHNIALVYGVLEGSSPGKVYTNRLDGSSCALVTVDEAFCYLGGIPTSEPESRNLVDFMLDVLLPQFIENELVLFAFTEATRASLAPHFHARGGIVIHRKIFEFIPQYFVEKNAGWRKKIPDELQLQAIDESIVEKNSGFSDLINPETRRFGVCLTAGDQIISVCKAVSVGKGHAEIEIFTEEAYRGQGLAVLTACAFIEECFTRGLRPAWSCWPHREASIALAKKLGFEERPDAPVFYRAGE